MPEKPKRASEYKSEDVELVRSTCLYVATRLGDLMDDVVIVGGLVPSLIIDQAALPDGSLPHVGTMDLDVGLKLAILDEGRYRTLTERLRNANFKPDETDEGRPTTQRWRVAHSKTVSVSGSAERPFPARMPPATSGCAARERSWCSRPSPSVVAERTRMPTTSTTSSATSARASRT